MSTPINGNIGRMAQYSASGSTADAGGEVIQVMDNGYVREYFAGLTVTNYIPSTGGSNGSAGGEATYTGDFYTYINNKGKAKAGCAVGVQGAVTGDQQFAIGGSGLAMSNTPGVTSVGLTGVAGSFLGENSIGIGVYAGINTNADNGTEFTPESCALLVDNRSTGKPLIIARSKNNRLELSDKCELSMTAIKTTTPVGSTPAQLRFGFSAGKLIVEINGTKFGVKLDPL